MKKEEVGNTVNNNNPQAGERGEGGKDFARDLTELERRKNYRVNTSIYLLNPDTALITSLARFAVPGTAWPSELSCDYNALP